MFDVLSLLLAAGGGFFAAAIGGLHAFIFTGFLALAGHAIMFAGGSSDFLGFAAFGPLFGPHIAFAAGVAAVAYAARTSNEVGGKDIGVPLIALERPDVLLVGAGFGMLGYIIQFGISKIPGFGSLTDSIALTVIISAFIVRLAFGRSSIFGNLPDGAGWGRFAPRDDAAWVRWHEKFVPNTVLGFFEDGGLGDPRPHHGDASPRATCTARVGRSRWAGRARQASSVAAGPSSTLRPPRSNRRGRQDER